MGAFLRTEQINAVLSLPTRQSIIWKTKLISLQCYCVLGALGRWDIFFLFGAHLCMCPQIYFTGVLRCDSRIVLYVFRIRTSIKLTNSEAVTIIHTAAGKTATWSVLDTFSRDWTTLTRYPGGHKSLLSWTYEYVHALDSLSPLCTMWTWERSCTPIFSSCSVVSFLQS